MFFFSRTKLHLFSSLLLLFVLFTAFMIDGVVQWQASRAAYAAGSPQTVYVGSDDGNVYAFNATNGARYWSFPTGGRVETKPVFANGVVYFGSQDDYVYALDASTGALVWRYKTGDIVNAGATVSHGIVYIGSWDGYLYAFNAKTGKVIWRFAYDKTATGAYSVNNSPAVENGIVYIGIS